MPKKKFPKSIRKYIRKEKARIRRDVLDIKEHKEKIDSIYAKVQPKNEDKGNS